MTPVYGWQLAGSLAAWAAAGLGVRMLIDPRRSLVAPVRSAIVWLDSRAAVRIVQVMAVVALAVSVVVGVKQYQLTRCIARYNEQSNISQRVRAAANDADRQALDNLIKVIADNPDQAVGALRTYDAARTGADKQRANSPIPDPPSETCG
jgi:hypothetical protein